MDEAIVYGAQSLVTGCWYIGKTVGTLEKRRVQHLRAAANNRPGEFYQALRDEGIDKFKWQIFTTCPKADAFRKEKQLIVALGAAQIPLLNSTHAKNNAKKLNSSAAPKSTASSEPGAVPLTRDPSSAGSSNKQKHGVNKHSLAGRAAWQSEQSKKFMQLSGRLKPVINLATNLPYISLLEAARKCPDSRPAIKRSCETGRPTPSGNLYAFVDTDGNPILEDGHKQGLPRTRRVKCLQSGTVYPSVAEAAAILGIKSAGISAVCAGSYLTAAKKSFCYIDEKGDEVLYESHHRYRAKMAKPKELFAAWHILDPDRKRIYYFESTAELAKTLGVIQAHVLEVCRGNRQHSKNWRVAYYDPVAKKLDLKDSHTAEVAKSTRSVICLDDQQEFLSLGIAAKEYGLNSSQIGKCCEGELKSTGGLRFAYLDEKGKPELHPSHLTPLGKKGHHRLVRPDNGEMFESVADCSRKTGVPQARIKRHLEDPSVSLGGFVLVVLD